MASSSSTTPYIYCLAENAESGNINDIAIRWQASALIRLDQEVTRTLQSRALLKALTEHFLYLTAYRIGSQAIKIT
jgi:hypothetical protein